MDWLGNCWADFFANLGAAQIKLPDNTANELRAVLQRALDTADYLGWAAARISKLDLWRPLGADGKLRRKAMIRITAGPQLSLTQHEYQTAGEGGVQCIHCGREAYTDKARTLLDCKPCQTTPLGQRRAAKSQRAAGA